MYDELKEQAVKNLKKERIKKRAIHVVGFVFAAISFILYAISLNFDSSVAYWIKFPILVLALVYGIIYFAAFGSPFSIGDEELTEEEIEREMVKIYKLQSKKDSSRSDDIGELELKEIEILKNKWEDDDEYV